MQFQKSLLGSYKLETTTFKSSSIMLFLVSKYSLLEQLLSSDLNGENKAVFFWPLTFQTLSEAEDLAANLCFPALVDKWTPCSFIWRSPDLPFDLSDLELEESLRDTASELSCESESALSRSDASCSCSHICPRFAFNPWQHRKRKKGGKSLIESSEQ